MNAIKKLTFLLVATVFFIHLGTFALAADSDDTTENEYVNSSPDTVYDVAVDCDYELPENNMDIDPSIQYFAFNGAQGNRINGDGSFTFQFSNEMPSTSFKPADTSIRVYATATSSTNNKTYYIGLYETGQTTPIKVVTYTANGNSQYGEFTGLSTNTYYHLYFSKPIYSAATITGSGQINYIQ